MRDAVKSRFNIEGAKQPRRVRQEQRATQKLFAFGDVAETPDSAGDFVANSLGSGEPFEDASVLKVLDVEALTFGIAV